MIIRACHEYTLPELLSLPTLEVNIYGNLKILSPGSNLLAAKRIWLDTNPEEEEFSNIVITEYFREDRGWFIGAKEYAIDPDVYEIGDWPYPGITFWWKQGNPSWRETTYETFIDQLQVVYPAEQMGRTFMAGEAWDIDHNGPVHAVFVQVGDRFFCREDWRVNFNPDEYRREIIQQYDIKE